MRKKRASALLLGIWLLTGCGGGVSTEHAAREAEMEKARVSAPPSGLPDGHDAPAFNPRAQSLSELHSKYRHVFIMEGSPRKRQVALTFDDAPDGRFTPQVLDMLKQNGVKATFFIVGSRAERYPGTVKRMIRDGHAIGNHSYSHANFLRLSNAQFRNEVTAANQAIAGITGKTPKLIRPPYGNVNEEQIKWLASRGFKIINWNVDSLDWKGLSSRQVAANVLGHAKPGAIILQHSGGGQGEDLTGTVQALPVIIRKLKHDGMEFVTVPELLGVPAY